MKCDFNKWDFNIITKNDVEMYNYKVRKYNEDVKNGKIKSEKIEEKDPSIADDNLSKLLKYIPAEVVAAWVCVDTFVRSANLSHNVYLVVFVILVVFAIIDIVFWRKVKRLWQIVLSLAAFGIYVWSMGGPFTVYSCYNAAWGGLGAILITFIMSFSDPFGVYDIPGPKALQEYIKKTASSSATHT